MQQPDEVAILLIERALREIDEYINAPQPRKALERAMHAQTTAPGIDSMARFWFMCALAHSLLPNPQIAIIREYRSNASACSDYTTEMETDFMRDELLLGLRGGRRVRDHKRQDYLEMLCGAQLGLSRVKLKDPNRVAIGVMAQARMLIAFGQVTRGLYLLGFALEDIREIPAEQRNMAWERNIRYQLMLEGSRLFRWRRRKAARALARELMADPDEKNVSHRKVALLVRWGLGRNPIYWLLRLQARRS